MNNNSGRKKKKGGVEEDAQSQQPSGMVSLPAIQNIPSYSSTATSSSWQSSHHPSHHSSSTIGGTSLLSDMTITSNLASLPVSESPYLALSAQQQELKKLLMASIKKQPAEEIDVRQAFGLKRSSTAKATSSNALIANKIPYSKAAEDAIITGAMKFSESMERNADSTVNLRAYQIPAQTLAAAPVSAGPATKAVKEAKASKEKKEKPSRAAKEAKEPPEPKAPKEKPKDREEVARLNKEKEERNAFRLKQLNHEMLVHKYHSFFLEEAGPVPMERKKVHIQYSIYV